MLDRQKTRVPLADRVYRPLGVTLALVATGVLYGILPLLEVYLLQELEATAGEAYIQGGVSISTWKVLQALYGGVVLMICIWAWWGRPPWVRFVLIGAILLPTLFNLWRVIDAWTSEIDPVFGGQAQEASRTFLLNCYLPGIILVPLYVVWYLNRAPARAFYWRVPLSELAAQDPRLAQPAQEGWPPPEDLSDQPTKTET
ncbi:MAG: hypothetical protein GYB65_09120 [Chloroflexi bacterium]|nr:hypothetical protein [Chloroflexota bacterium]